MSFAISIIIAVVFSIVFRKPLQRSPWVFYILAVLICAAGIYLTYSPLSNQIVRVIAYAIQKGHLGLALFAVVMFVGVFDRNSVVRRYFTPVRAELSIVASILIVGHLAPYLGNYFGHISSFFSLRPSIISSLIIALILLVLLILLFLTSFNFVKKKMDAGKWKSVQKLAYPFFGLIFFHLFGYLLIPTLSGSATALINVIIYGLLFILYSGLRVRRALLDRSRTVTRTTLSANEGYTS